MKQLNFVNAIISSFVLLVLASFVMGLQLQLDGTRLVVQGASEVRWLWIGAGCLVVFCFQLVRPLIQQGIKKSQARRGCCPVLMAPHRGKNSWQPWLLSPQLPGHFSLSRLCRYRHPNADLRHVGAGIECRRRAIRPAGTGLRRFYAIGAYTYALLNHYYGLGFGKAYRWPG